MLGGIGGRERRGRLRMTDVKKHLFRCILDTCAFSLEGMMPKLKLQYFGHLMQRVDSLEKTDAGRDWGQEEKGTTEDEMAGWYH